jgi:acetyl-CoA carboxylase biotin carboxyl carrier protein
MDLERVEKLAKLFGASRAQELAVEAEDWHVLMRRGPIRPPATPSTTVEWPASEQLAPVEPVDVETAAVTAPLVGIFRQGNGKIEMGDILHVGDEVGGIESMKILSPVVCEVGGQVLEVMIEDGHPVAYGQPLYLLAPLPEDGEEGEQ